MILLHPIALAWILLAVPVALLYWRKLRVRRVSVAPVHIWKQVFSAIPPGPAWRRWRRQISLAVQAAVILLLAIAMAEPLFRVPRALLLVIDNASSGVDSEAVAARLDKARRAAFARLEDLGHRDRAAIITTGDVLRVRCGLTDSRRHLRQAIESVQVAVGHADPAGAVALAKRLVAGDATASVAVLTDDPGRFSLPASDEVEYVPIGSPAGLAVLSRFVPRPPAWSFLAVIALGLMTAEWCFHQRRWTE